MHTGTLDNEEKLDSLTKKKVKRLEYFYQTSILSAAFCKSL